MGCFGEDVVLCREFLAKGYKCISHCVEVSDMVIWPFLGQSGGGSCIFWLDVLCVARSLLTALHGNVQMVGW